MMTFVWDESKNQSNLDKHGVSFEEAQLAFADSAAYVEADLAHSTPDEVRYFCYGNVSGTVITVRFTVRNGVIRIFGAGKWRQGRRVYENH